MSKQQQWFLRFVSGEQSECFDYHLYSSAYVCMLVWVMESSIETYIKSVVVNAYVTYLL